MDLLFRINKILNRLSKTVEHILIYLHNNRLDFLWGLVKFYLDGPES